MPRSARIPGQVALVVVVAAAMRGPEDKSYNWSHVKIDPIQT